MFGEEYLEKASFYKRKATSSDSTEKLFVLDEDGGFFVNDATYIAKWIEEKNSFHKECYIYAEYSCSLLLSTKSFFMVGEEVINIIIELRKIPKLYTKESCAKAFISYPSVWEIIQPDFIEDYSWGAYSNYIYKYTHYYNANKSKFISEIGIKRSKELSLFVDNLLLELRNLKIDTSILEKKPEPSQANSSFQLPPWLQKALVYGGVFAVKFTARSFGQDVDIQIPDFGIDVDIDVDVDSNVDPNYNFDIATDSPDYIVNDGQTGNNISFGHAPNDGSYMKTNQDINIQVAGGNDKGSYDVYLHNGDKYIDFKDQWIKIQGKTRFHLNGNDYIIKRI